MTTRFKSPIRIVFLALIGTLILSGCAKGDSAKPVAIVNGTPITAGDLDAEIESFEQQFAAQGRTIPEDQIASFRNDVLESLIRKTVLLTAASTVGITIDSGQVDKEIAKIRERYVSDEQYEKALASQGYSVDSLRTEVKNNLAISALIDKEVLSFIDIPEETIASFYKANSTYFVVPESVTASHILVEVKDDASEKDQEKALDKIKKIQTKLAEGADFAELAKKESEGPSASDGGDLGTFGRGQMVPPFEEAAFALEPGGISDIVTTQFGYHIIYVREKTAGRTQPYEEVKDDIVQYLKQQKGETQVSQYIDSVIADAKIERFTPTETTTE